MQSLGLPAACVSAREGGRFPRRRGWAEWLVMARVGEAMRHRIKVLSPPAPETGGRSYAASALEPLPEVGSSCLLSAK